MRRTAPPPPQPAPPSPVSCLPWETGRLAGIARTSRGVRLCLSCWPRLDKPLAALVLAGTGNRPGLELQLFSSDVTQTGDRGLGMQPCPGIGPQDMAELLRGTPS